MTLPIMNGKSAELAVKMAGGLLFVLALCYTAIIISDNEIPGEFAAIGTALVGGLVGFLAGTRVVPPDVSGAIKQEPMTAVETEALHDAKR